MFRLKPQLLAGFYLFIGSGQSNSHPFEDPSIGKDDPNLSRELKPVISQSMLVKTVVLFYVQKFAFLHNKLHEISFG